MLLGEASVDKLDFIEESAYSGPGVLIEDLYGGLINMVGDEFEILVYAHIPAVFFKQALCL
jgi:hypothetical protein